MENTHTSTPAPDQAPSAAPKKKRVRQRDLERSLEYKNKKKGQPASHGEASHAAGKPAAAKPAAGKPAAVGGNDQQPTRNPLNKSGLSCPIEDKCGGCQMLGISYKTQLKIKQGQMELLFGQVLDPECEVNAICGMNNPKHYRNKVVSPFVGIFDKRLRKRRVLCGMYEKGTHRVINSRECLIENTQAKAIICSIRDMMLGYGIEPYNEDEDTGMLRHAQVRVGHTSGEIMVTLVTREEAFPQAKSFVKALVAKHPQITTVVQNVNTKRTNAIMGDVEHRLYGPGFILDDLCGLRFRISSRSFYQVNSRQTEVLYTRAVQMARLTGTEKVLDAYCGTGTIGLVAAKGIAGAPGAAQVLGVEERPDAVADARNNAARNGIESATFIQADASSYLRALANRGERYDVLFMDPPRAGSTPEFLEAAVALAPERIVYVSCNPETQLRDAQYLIEQGYRIMEMQPVDMFPHTPHVENIIMLSKRADQKDTAGAGGVVAADGPATDAAAAAGAPDIVDRDASPCGMKECEDCHESGE
ncbi:MAG: 23S rRNA (uracil(1939)-C(5))-methyltransferase RlmD [Eggerthellales bacterium]|nr:23S rRNA (uracil(1939)-C(5))-methyltransferase RlmD [Eggerthellales bacterium]